MYVYICVPYNYLHIKSANVYVSALYVTVIIIFTLETLY